MKKLLGWGAAVLMLAGTVTGAEAAKCRASTLEGRWVAVNSVISGFLGSCEITIAKNGTITAGRCQSLIPAALYDVTGKYYLKKNCKLTARMTITNGISTWKRTYAGEMFQKGTWAIDMDANDGSHAHLAKQFDEAR